MEVCQGGNHWIYTLIDPVVTTETWMRTTAGHRAHTHTHTLTHTPVSMEFPPSPIIYSEAIFQENSQPASLRKCFQENNFQRMAEEQNKQSTAIRW